MKIGESIRSLCWRWKCVKIKEFYLIRAVFCCQLIATFEYLWFFPACQRALQLSHPKSNIATFSVVFLVAICARPAEKIKIKFDVISDFYFSFFLKRLAFRTYLGHKQNLKGIYPDCEIYTSALNALTMITKAYIFACRSVFYFCFDFYAGNRAWLSHK